jgi:hypothetical protein
MPIIRPSTYRAPAWLPGGHLQTIFPALFNRVPLLTRVRERIATPDGDFLDLDWARAPAHRRLAILTHGLEGSSHDSSVQSVAHALHRDGWDILAWNFRGCSGTANLRLRSYHSGSTDDLASVIDHALATETPDEVALVGFSLGGNVTLKYLGDLGPAVDPRLTAAVAFSVPCDLAASSLALENRANRIYMDRFLFNLRRKIREKMVAHPGELTDHGLDAMRTFREFDGAYTAPLHGYRDAQDYWTRASSKPVLPHITIPTLLVNARNDPFLPAACLPESEATASTHFHLEIPATGGHLGFPRNWMPHRTTTFLQTNPQNLKTPAPQLSLRLTQPADTFPTFSFSQSINPIRKMPDEVPNPISATPDATESNLESSQAHAEAAADTSKSAAKDIYSSTKKKAEDAIATSKAQLSKAAQDLSEAGKAKYEDLKTQAAAKGEVYKAKAEDAYGEAQAKAKVFQSDSEQYIRDNPLQAVGIAAGIGFLIGIILRK